MAHVRGPWVEEKGIRHEDLMHKFGRYAGGLERLRSSSKHGRHVEDLKDVTSSVLCQEKVSREVPRPSKLDRSKALQSMGVERRRIDGEGLEQVGIDRRV